MCGTLLAVNVEALTLCEQVHWKVLPLTTTPLSLIISLSLVKCCGEVWLRFISIVAPDVLLVTVTPVGVS
ncbi:hypothetical protein NAI66_04180 [Francisella tularensis subsp. holarctica]|nr:hypothetical protein [Francisella tularensis]MDE4937284.1 hypothetical protein [Francisella tularensis subsp. holarctica]MBZ5730224.1 hypothetical protein [Francisella tularensis]MBZ5731930.1 hypothetical protein [Francisella tularensis]MBZ5742129.1 hypothetical protein [Francisella tularensis]MBZ5743734.1 hypothetical protein [Francisella tularensis]